MRTLKTLSICCHKSLKFNFRLPSELIKLLELVGYLSLLGPSKSLNLMHQQKGKDNELFGLTIEAILIAETAMRAGFFIIISYIIEFLFGEHNFELLKLDYFLACIIIAGVIHIISYYIGLVIFREWGYKLYRLGRNTCYAIVPALIATIIALSYQWQNQSELYSGTLIKDVITIVYTLFLCIGIVESVSMQGQPSTIKK